MSRNPMVDGDGSSPHSGSAEFSGLTEGEKRSRFKDGVPDVGRFQVLYRPKGVLTWKINGDGTGWGAQLPSLVGLNHQRLDSSLTGWWLAKRDAWQETTKQLHGRPSPPPLICSKEQLLFFVHNNSLWVGVNAFCFEPPNQLQNEVDSHEKNAVDKIDIDMWKGRN